MTSARVDLASSARKPETGFVSYFVATDRREPGFERDDGSVIQFEHESDKTRAVAPFCLLANAPEATKRSRPDACAIHVGVSEFDCPRAPIEGNSHEGEEDRSGQSDTRTDQGQEDSMQDTVGLNAKDSNREGSHSQQPHESGEQPGKVLYDETMRRVLYDAHRPYIA